MNRQDRIERQMIVPHSPERVWAALTTPASLSHRFGDSAEIDLRPGGTARFGWSEYASTLSAVVEVVDPPRVFAFRCSARLNVPTREARRHS